MQSSNVGTLAIVLLMGVLAGTIGTVAVYHRTAAQQAEAQESEARETLKAVEEERDRLQAQVNDYQEAERKQQEALEQPTGVEPAARPAVPQRPLVAVTPRKDTVPSAKDREGAPAPREDDSVNAKTTTPPVGGFGPPRVPPQQDDNAPDTKPKTTP